MEYSPSMLKQLLKQISSTKPVELDCQQVYDVIDVYAEMKARGEDPAGLLPMVKHHLEMCKDCVEEYEALMRILEEDPSQ